MNNKTPRRIMYALGCALILSLHSLTPRSTFGQQSERAREHSAEVASPGAMPARERSVAVVAVAAHSARDAPAPNHTTDIASPSATPARERTGAVVAASAAREHSITAASPRAQEAHASEHTATVESPEQSGNSEVAALPTRAAEDMAERASPSARDAHTPSRELVSAQVASATPSEHGGVVNLNTATAAELERLPRIGPARSQAILALRAKVTRFSKVEQLLRVKGIGRATFRKLRPMLALEGPTTLTERRSR